MRLLLVAVPPRVGALNQQLGFAAIPSVVCDTEAVGARLEDLQGAGVEQDEAHVLEVAARFGSRL